MWAAYITKQLTNAASMFINVKVTLSISTIDFVEVTVQWLKVIWLHKQDMHLLSPPTSIGHVAGQFARNIKDIGNDCNNKGNFTLMTYQYELRPW